MVVFLTYARGWQTLAATRSLGEKKIEVITSDSISFAPCYYSKYSKHDFRYDRVSEEKKFISSLIKNIKKYSKSKDDVLLPVFKETYIISKYLDKFKDLVKIPITNYSNLQHVHDKWKLYKLAKELGIRAPDTFQPKTKKELDSVIKKISFPVVIKILDAAGGLGVKFVYNEKELRYWHNKMIKEYNETPLIQQFIKGSDYCVTVLFNKGKPRAKMTYKNIKQFPPKTGVGVLSKTVKENEMEKIAFKICKKLNWHGVAEFDFRKEKGTGKVYLIECNPRFWVSLNQSIKSQIDYPYLLYQIATTGDCPKELKPDYGTETEFYAGNLATNIIEVINAKSKSKKIYHLLKHHKKVYKDVLSWQDPFPVLGALYPVSLLIKHGKLDVDTLMYS